MKLCVLGPADNTAERNTAIVKRAFPELEVYQVSYQVYTEALDLIDEIQEEADAILFPGKASYRLCEKNRVPLVPWEYIPRHVSSLHRTMLEVQTKYQCGLSNISYDTLDRELILSAYEEIGIPHKNARFFLAEQHLLDPGYLPYLIEFHTTNYLRKGAACCITGLTEIAGELRQRKIPCAVTLPASALIVDTARKLQLRYEAKQNLENWIVVIMVKLTYSGNYSLLGKDDYGYITNRIKVLESVYTYSYRIDGTVVEEGSDGFLIFTTRRAIALETGQFKNFYLLDMLDGCRAENVAAGIGCGRTASESKSNAYAAMELSKKAKGNCAYVILEDGSVLRPMRPGRKDSRRSTRGWRPWPGGRSSAATPFIPSGRAPSAARGRSSPPSSWRTSAASTCGPWTVFCRSSWRWAAAPWWAWSSPRATAGPAGSSASTGRSRCERRG